MVFIAYEYCVTLQQRLFKEASSLLPISTPLIFNKALFEEFMRIITALIQGYDVLHVKAFEAWFETLYEARRSENNRCDCRTNRFFPSKSP
jgi:hypothetical protein